MPKQPLRHIPERTCIVCRHKGAKRGLVRLVRTPQGTVEVDLSGKKSGRGAYLCPIAACWEGGLKKKRLDYTLKIVISEENRKKLLEYSKTLPRKEVPDAL